MKQKRTRITPEIQKQIKELRYEGLTQQEVAEHLDISQSAVEKWCDKLNIHISPYAELTEEIEVQVLEARNKGIQQDKIADQLNISRSSVQKIYKRNGVKAIPKRHWKITPEVEQKILALRKDGLTQRQIAKKLGIGRSSVAKVYDRLGIEGLPNGKINEEVWQQILELKEGGMIIPEIAQTIGVNRASIQAQFNKRGISIAKFHITPEIEKVIMQLREEGNGTRSIAKILGCSRHTVQDYLQEKGIKNETPPPKKKEIPTHKTCTNCLEHLEIKCFRMQKRKLKDGTITGSYNSNCERCRQLRKAVSGAIHAYLKTEGLGGYNISAMAHLPYNVRDLKLHIENLFSHTDNLKDGKVWMTWDNWGVYDPKTHDINPTWQIDHIIPHSTFKYKSMEDQAFLDCWALSNLRPLDARINNDDGVRRTRHPK
jgi:predicted transcriptional regulator